MRPIRNSVKALIIQDGKLLLNKMHYDDLNEVFYIVPGGGQEPGESFIQTLYRECLEEIGAQVVVHDLVLVREYIGKNHEFAYRDAEAHQMEYLFLCELASPVDLSLATVMDNGQLGCEWIDLKDLPCTNIYPKALRNCIDANGKITSPVYMGDVN